LARAVLLLAVALLTHVSYSAQAWAAGNLDRLIQSIDPKELFPMADRFDRLDDTPPVVRAQRGDELLGYIFLNSDFVNATGYSGRPIHTLIAIDMDSVIRGTRLAEHHEPIVLIGIPERKITAVMEGYVGLNVADFVRDSSDHRVDIVSGATVTVMVIDDSILRSAIKVARTYGLGGMERVAQEAKGPARVLDTSISTVEDWTTLIGDGSLRRLRLTVGDINQAFEESDDLIAAQRAEPGDPEEPYIELYAALVSIPPWAGTPSRAPAMCAAAFSTASR
jgi:NosR/NirI family nitrous oxide reductase transcriptional regulator